MSAWRVVTQPGNDYEVLSYERFESAVNYGVNRVSLPRRAPVGAPSGCERSQNALEPLPGGGTDTVTLSFQTDGSDKFCAAETLTRVRVAIGSELRSKEE